MWEIGEGLGKGVWPRPEGFGQLKQVASLHFAVPPQIVWLALACTIFLLWVHWPSASESVSSLRTHTLFCLEAHHIPPSLFFVNLSFLEVTASRKPSVTFKSRLGSLFPALIVMVFGAFPALSSVYP